MANIIKSVVNVSHYPDGSFDSTFKLDQRAFSNTDSYTWQSVVVGSVTPVTSAQVPVAKTGHSIPGYTSDFYERTHVQPVSFDLGFIGSPVSRSIEVWNARFSTNDTLTAINKNPADESVVITAPVANPAVFLPLQSRQYTLDVSDQGPAESDVTFTFDFVSLDIDVTVVGSRIVLFPFVPEDFVDQDFTWGTTVQTSFGGYETTQKFRDIPREAITYNFRSSERTAISNKILSGHSSNIGVPKWIQFTPLTTALAIDGTQIFCDVSKIDIAAEDTLFIFSEAEGFFFTRVLTVEIDHYTIDPSTKAFPIGSLVMRTMVARIAPTVSFALYPVGAPDYQVKFNSVDYVDLVTASLPRQFNTYDVLEDASIMSSVTQQFNSTVLTDLVDYNSGPFTFFSRSSDPNLRFRTRKFLVGLDVIRDYQKWLFKIAGRNGRFWVIGHSSDIEVLTTILLSDSNITIRNISLTALFPLETGNFYVYVKLTDGTVFIKRVLNVIETSSTIETLVMETTFGQQIEPEEILLFDRLHFVRMVSDNVRFRYERPAQCTVEFEVVETR